MKRADTFERGWNRFIAGRQASGLFDDVAPELATAALLHDFGQALGGQAQPTYDEWASLVDRIDAGERSNVVTMDTRRPHRPIRVGIAVAAAFALLLAGSLRAGPDSPLYRVRRGSEQLALLLTPHDGALHLRLAGARLDDLLFALSKGEFGRVPSLADALQAERTAAVEGGADVQLLDARMTSALTPALARAPATVAHTVRDCLTDAVPDDEHDAPGDSTNPDAESDEGDDESGVIPGQSAPSTAPWQHQPATAPSYTGSSDEDDSSSGSSD